MNNSKFISLLVKKIKGKLEDQDAASLDQCLAAEEQKKSAKQLEKVWDLSGQYKSNYEPDVEAGLAKFKNRISRETTAIDSPRVINIRRRRFSLAWAASIAVLMLALGWWWKRTTTNGATIAITQKEEQKAVKLPDGSQVILNELSELDFSDFSQDDTRVVQFSGEAYFDIVPDSEHPFVIRTNDTEVKVLGTSFNLRAYQTESFTEVEVESGKVELKKKATSEGLLLNANDKGVYEKNGPMTKEKVHHLNALSWRSQSLAFRNTALEKVVPYLERHFKIDIEVASSLRQCPVTSDFEILSQDKVFLTLERIFNAKVEQIDAKHYVIKGNGC